MLVIIALGVIWLLEIGEVNNCIVYGSEQLEASLCKSKNCPFYGKCKIDESGFYAKCVCPDECDLSSTSQVFVFSDYEYEPSSSSSGPSSSPSNSILNRAIASSSTSSNKGQKSKELITNELFSQIVCGSDGVDYKNFCQLKKESCQLSKEIKVYYFGKCSTYTINKSS